MARAIQPALLVFTLLLLVPLASAQSYTVTDLGLLSGDTTSQARARSPAGQVVGDDEYNLQGFVWTPSQGMLGLPHLRKILGRDGHQRHRDDRRLRHQIGRAHV